MLSWRRSSLMVALPVLVLTVVLQVWDAVHTDTSNFTALGTLCVWLPPIGLLLVPLGVLHGLHRWTEVRGTSTILVAVWGLSIVLPLLTALVPIDLVLDVDGLRAQVAGTGAEQVLEQAIQAGRLALAINYALALLPVVVSVPGGVLKGAQRVKSLFPTTALPGWFLVAVAPFYSMFVIVVFVMIDQLVGNPALLLAVGLFAATPMLFVVHRRHYTRAMTAEQARRELGRASRIGGVLTLAGIAFVLVFVFTGNGRRAEGRRQRRLRVLQLPRPRPHRIRGRQPRHLHLGGVLPDLPRGGVRRVAVEPRDAGRGASRARGRDAGAEPLRRGALSEELLQRGQGGLRRLFRQEMAAVHAGRPDVLGVLAPDRVHVVLRADETA